MQLQAKVAPFFEGFVLLSGTGGDIQAIVKQFPQSLTSTPNRVAKLNSMPKGWTGNIQLPFQTTTDLQVHLYETNLPVKDMIEAIYQVKDAKSPVFADPNYALTGDLWSVAGGSWSPESPIPGTFGDANDAFWKQWAFGEQGIRLFTDALATRRTVEPRGQGIRVGIFDTSPFTGISVGPDEAPTEIPIPWMLQEALSLYVSHPYDTPVIPPVNYNINCSNHGLFAAGLVHAVAPESEIHLIRALNKNAMGDLFTLVQALHWFIDRWWDTLDNTIINLSLGVHSADETDLAPGTKGEILALIRSMGTSYVSPSTLASADEIPIMALETILGIAQGRGAVIAAAAGNSSYDVVSPNPAQIPASYPDVIGVAASNMARQQSCYSNDGDVAAPGGDGGAIGALPCAPNNQACASLVGDCPYGLISLVDEPDSPSGYAYWVGTSFATPLVSGLAALLRENGTTPPNVRGAVMAGVKDGIIDLPTALP